jgi:hypothetical protein
MATNEATLQLVEEDGVPVLYCVVDSKRIAKRYSKQQWISLEPGYTVRRSKPDNTLTVEYDPIGAEPQ